jgi:tripartite-type tricarboxylate transporter receptor subunit TctC
MNPTRRRIAAGLGLACTGALGALASWPSRAAAAWPTKPIRIVVGYPAGGLVDSLARAYGEHISVKLGQPVIVENKPGAAGMLAGADVARAAPDGHTLWLTLSGATGQNRVFFQNVPYDPDNGFTHVSGFDPGPLPLGVNAASKVRNMRDLIELGRTQWITFGNFAPGSLPQMMAQQLAKRYGLNLEPVPYKGESAMWQGLASGEITVALGSAMAMSPHLQSGKVRAISVSSRSRSILLPQVPTFDEQGYADPIFTVQGWVGLLAPAGTPAPVIQRLSDLVQDAAATPRVREINKTYGMPEKPWTAAEFARIDAVNKPIWIALARELNIALD